MKSKVFIVLVLMFAGWMAWNAYAVVSTIKNPIVVALKAE